MNSQHEDTCIKIKDSLTSEGLFSLPGGPGDTGEKVNSWRVSPCPFYISPKERDFFVDLGPHLLKFYKTLNQFYFDSMSGKLAPWFAEYLNRGKPADLINFSRMKRFRNHLPGIIRPDVIPTENGFAVTELDSVPGGFGLTTALATLYSNVENENIIGSENGGIASLFYKMLESVARKKDCVVALIVSDEAEDYRSEMQYLGRILRKAGHPVYVKHPRELVFRESGLYLEEDGVEIAVSAVYRFYELFDLLNIPKAELIQYAIKKGTVSVSPPYKPFLEEKLVFSLFHHPALHTLWKKELGSETFEILTHLIPKTWTLDNRELPPHGVIPDLKVKGTPVQNWGVLNDLTQKERQLVLKPSGFSPLSWGSRGVTVGHDVSSEEWKIALKEGLENFSQSPSILQDFHKGKQYPVHFWDWKSSTLKEMQGRVRLTPYYFVVEDQARLGGILATICPSDKKKIHGMSTAIMVPCAVKITSDKDLQ
jgi:hypothetical protein